MAQGILGVYINSARNLLAADSNGKSDPYCVVKLLGLKMKTHVIRETLNPVWGVKLEFMEVDLEEVVAKGMRLELFDYDMFSRDDPIGALDVDLSKLRSLKKNEPLSFDEALPTKGSLAFTVTWTELPRRLTATGTMHVVIESASELMSADTNGKSDPYVKLYHGDDKFKTKVAKATLSPVWNQTFTLKGKLHELTAKRLRLEVYDHDTFSRDDAIGACDVSLAALELVDEKAFEAKLKTAKSQQGLVKLKLKWVADDAGGGGGGGEGGSSARPSTAGGAAGANTEHIVKCGLLRMKVGSVITGWKERFFELGEDDLAYFASEALAKAGGQALGVLPLEMIKKISPSTSEPTRFTLKLGALKGGGHGGASSERASARSSALSSHGPQVTVSQIKLCVREKDGLHARDEWVRSIQLLADAENVRASRYSQTSGRAEGSTLLGSHRGSMGDEASSSAGGDGGHGGAAGFGEPLESHVLVQDASGLRVPAALSLLWSELQRRPLEDGVGSEGIFRLSAPADEVNRVRASMESASGAREALPKASPQCLAALIKKFMRDLPDDLWAEAREEIMELDHAGGLVAGGGDGDDGADADAAAAEAHGVVQALVAQLTPSAADLVVWVCDVMSVVLSHEAANRMNTGAIATVFAPGLVHPPLGSTDPGSFMVWSQIGNHLTSMLVRAHSKRRLTTPTTEDEEPAAASAASADASDGAPAAVAAAAAAVEEVEEDPDDPELSLSPESTPREPRGRRNRRSVEDRMVGLEALMKEMGTEAAAPRGGGGGGGGALPRKGDAPVDVD